MMIAWSLVDLTKELVYNRVMKLKQMKIDLNGESIYMEVKICCFSKRSMSTKRPRAY